MSEEIKKALLETGRVIVLAVLPNLIVSIEQGEINWELIWGSVAIALLRFIDKYIHEMGKSSGNDSLTLGITRF